MQRGRRGRGPFDDPFFSSFGDPFAGFGSFGGQGSLMSSFFGGRDPFDDPFFTRPFGGLSDSMGSGFFGGNGFPSMAQSGFIENQAFPNSYQQGPEPKRSRGPIIEEINSDEENEETDQERVARRQFARSSIEPHVEDPDDVEHRNTQLQGRSNRMNDMQQYLPRTHGYSFQSSTFTYGGADGAYYTSSRTQRTGSDGVTFEESKEADTSTRQATHKIHRALHDKGHSVTRKLKSDGEVDTMQMLHNLNEDELAGFEESWKGKAPKQLHGLNENLLSGGSGSSAHNGPMNREARALPSTELPQSSRRVMPDARGRAGPQVHHSGKKKADGKGKRERH